MANVKGCGFRAVCDNGNKRSTRKITCFSRVTDSWMGLGRIIHFTKNKYTITDKAQQSYYSSESRVLRAELLIPPPEPAIRGGIPGNRLPLWKPRTSAANSERRTCRGNASSRPVLDRACQFKGCFTAVARKQALHSPLSEERAEERGCGKQVFFGLHQNPAVSE